MSFRLPLLHPTKKIWKKKSKPAGGGKLNIYVHPCGRSPKLGETLNDLTVSFCCTEIPLLLIPSVGGTYDWSHSGGPYIS